MKYQTTKSIWFPTQSTAFFVKRKSYVKTVGLYGPSGRYPISMKLENLTLIVLSAWLSPVIQSNTTIHYKTEKVNKKTYYICRQKPIR